MTRAVRQLPRYPGRGLGVSGGGLRGGAHVRQSRSLRRSMHVRRGTTTNGHPLCRAEENKRLYEYERGVKGAFEEIIPALKRISAMQGDVEFKLMAQQAAQAQLGFNLPDDILDNAWINRLDMRGLFAWSIFKTYQSYCDDYYRNNPLTCGEDADFEVFLQRCGFHILDISPCSDGRLAHLVRYVLRLPQQVVRRKSYAGAMFDVEDSVQKWVEIELSRYRESVPNSIDQPTRYLKMVAYHYSSVDPDKQGCAAHGSNTEAAAKAGLERLNAFREAIENGFCCGASIDLLLIGVDTDTDAIRVHVPDAQGTLSLDKAIDVKALYENSLSTTPEQARLKISDAVRACEGTVQPGMARFIERLIENNISQIEYVRNFHGHGYSDIGHAEYFIGVGVGFHEVQLRNLMYFAYLDTIEEGAADLDVGIKIFSGLNLARGLPIPVIVRFDYHGKVPGSRGRAKERCQRVALAIENRFPDLVSRGLLYILQVTRDCDDSSSVEVLQCSVSGAHAEA